MRYLRIIIPLIIVISIIVFVMTSNVARSFGTAEFTPGIDGINKLEMTGPNGWYCIEYSKAVNSTGGSLELAGRGYSVCPLFGAVITVSNAYPREGRVDNIPLEQPVMIYQDDSKTYEIYVLFTRELAKYESLDD